MAHHPLSEDEVRAWPVGHDGDARRHLSETLTRQGHFGPTQLAGRNFAMGCVALEVTQRCNLDCAACYLTENAEITPDPELDDLLARVDRIRALYGPLVTVQVTGGDPTLRPLPDLIAIVRRIHENGLRSALFTNGVKASRPMLTALAEAGLTDVAFHVDMTQGRKGYGSEAELNAVRADCLTRARGLGLKILFNTTVTNDTLASLPALCGWFADHAEDIHMVSFQLQAETGRGTLGRRQRRLNRKSVEWAISSGLGADLTFDTPLIGHPDCNGYSATLVFGSGAGRRVRPIFESAPRLFRRAFRHFASIRPDRRTARGVMTAVARAFLSKPLAFASLAPGLALLGLRWGIDWLSARGRAHKLSFYIHDFMDADRLERGRCEACVFMVMGRDGPISMCVHNAKRDLMLFGEDGAPGPVPAKLRKGRAKKHTLIDLSQGRTAA